MVSKAALHDPRRPKPAPPEYAGQWVAWNREQTEIVAHGRTLAEVDAAVTEGRFENAIFQKVPRLGERFIGAV